MSKRTSGAIASLVERHREKPDDANVQESKNQDQDRGDPGREIEETLHVPQSNSTNGVEFANFRQHTSPDEMFTGAHWHLLVNHAPIFGCIVAFGLLLFSYFAATDTLRRTAFVVLIITGIAGFLADKTGEPAEDAIRGYPGVKRAIIHDHEEMAEKAWILAAALGVISIGALVKWKRKPIPGGLTLVMLLATAFVGGAMVYTGLLGGRIRHTEVRPGATDTDATVIEPRRQRPPRPPTS